MATTSAPQKFVPLAGLVANATFSAADATGHIAAADVDAWIVKNASASAITVTPRTGSVSGAAITVPANSLEIIVVGQRDGAPRQSHSLTLSAVASVTVAAITFP